MSQKNSLKSMRLDAQKFYIGEGAYKRMLDTSKENGDLSPFGLTTEHNHHYFGCVQTNRVHDILRRYNHNICEVLTKYPKRVYFDIDAVGASMSIDDVLDIMKKHFGLTSQSVTIAGYITDEKTSYHVIARELYLTNADDMDKLKQMVKYVKSLGGMCAHLDDCVYTQNRQMKCIYQSKHKATKALPLWPSADFDYRLFFIGLFTHPKPVRYFDGTTIPEESLASIKIDMSSDIITTPRELPSFIGLTSDITEPKNILRLIPSDNDLSHGHRWKVALFCYFNGLTEADYMGWFMSGNPSEARAKKVSKFWKNPSLKNEEFSVSVPSMLKYLSKWYPDLSSDNHNTDAFTKSFELSGVKTDDVTWLNSEHFSGPQKVVVVNIPMGGGKTTATLKYLDENQKKSFVWLAPRQTLVLNTTHRMNNEFKIKHLSHLQVGTNKGKLRTAERLLICNQSLHHLCEDQSFDIVIIDEIESVLLSWMDDETHKDNMEENFKRFCKIIQSAKKIILLDAFTTTKTFKLLYSLGIKNTDIQLYQGGSPPKHKQVIFNNNFDAITSKIVDAYFKGEKSFIFYPYKKGTEKTHYGIVEYDAKIKELIKTRKLASAKTDKERLGIHENTGVSSLLYYAESKEKNNLGDINTLWADADYILTTSSITVGVNYEGLDYHNIFLLVSGSTNNPRDVIQSSMRIRHPVNSSLNVYFFDIKDKDLKKYPTYYHKTDDIYKSLIVENLRELQAGFVETFTKFCDLAKYDIDGDLKKIMVNRRKTKFINDMFESGQLIEYYKVENISDLEIEEREKLIYSRNASVMDRLAVDKFYYNSFMRNVSEEDRAFVWNTNSRQFFKGIKSELFTLTCKDANTDDILDVNWNTLEVSKDTIEYIKKHYSITKIKKPTWVLVDVINDALGFNAITSKKDKRNKHLSFEISDRFNSLYEVYQTKKKNDEAAYVHFIEEEAEERLKIDTYYQLQSEFFKGITEDDIIWVECPLGGHYECRIPLPEFKL